MSRHWSVGAAASLAIGIAFLTPSARTVHAACDPAPSGLVSSWQAEGDFLDCQGVHHGTEVGSVPFGAGKIGQAFTYSINDANYVNLGNPAGLKFTDAITIAAWIYPTAAPDPSNLRAIVTKWAQVFTGPHSGQDSYGLWTENGTGGFLRVFGALNLDTGSGSTEPNLSGGNVPLNAWSHVAMTFYRSTSDVNMAVYLNCTAVASTAVGDLPIIASDKNVFIGREDSYQTRPFAGSIDQVRIFNRALSASEIAQLVTDTDPSACLIPVELSRFQID